MSLVNQHILFSTAYFPPLSYFSLLIACDTAEIEVHETFAKQTYRNRCRILTANGVIQLTVPVVKPAGNHTRTRDILVSDRERWQQIHWRAITSAYRAAPYFAHYADAMQPVFTAPHHQLVVLNRHIIQLILQMLHQNVQLTESVAFEHHPPGKSDLRNLFSPKTPPDQTMFKPYYQVFNDRYAFQADLSILDLLFNEGPAAVGYLRALAAIIQGKQS